MCASDHTAHSSTFSDTCSMPRVTSFPKALLSSPFSSSPNAPPSLEYIHESVDGE